MMMMMLMMKVQMLMTKVQRLMIKIQKNHLLLVKTYLYKNISVIQKAGLIEEKTCNILQKKFKHCSSSTDTTHTEISGDEEQQEKKFTQFVEVNHNLFSLQRRPSICNI